MLVEYLLEKAKKKRLGAIERAKTLERLIKEGGLTSKQIAEKIKRSPAYVSNALRLLTLPEALQDALASDLISAGHARALAAIKDKRAMIEVYKKILKEEGSVRLAEKLAREIRTKAAKKKIAKQDIWEKIKREISEVLDEAEVDLSRSRVQSRLTITLKGGYEKTEAWLEKIHHLLTKPTSVKGQ